MRITWKELTVNMDSIDRDGLLSEWRWLVDETYHPILISSLGDLFLQRETDDHVFWLNAGTGELTEIAESPEEFKQLMVQRENADEWFVPQLVGDIMKQGQRLAPGQCFGYKKPPVLGGEIKPDNFEPTDLEVHFSILGQIHNQVKDLPDGAPIKLKIRDPRA